MLRAFRRKPKHDADIADQLEALTAVPMSGGEEVTVTATSGSVDASADHPLNRPYRGACEVYRDGGHGSVVSVLPASKNADSASKLHVKVTPAANVTIRFWVY